MQNSETKFDLKRFFAPGGSRGRSVRPYNFFAEDFYRFQAFFLTDIFGCCRLCRWFGAACLIGPKTPSTDEQGWVRLILISPGSRQKVPGGWAQERHRGPKSPKLAPDQSQAIRSGKNSSGCHRPRKGYKKKIISQKIIIFFHS